MKEVPERITEERCEKHNEEFQHFGETYLEGKTQGHGPGASNHDLLRQVT